MQITLNAVNSAETRLVAAFLNDLADLQELQRGAPLPAGLDLPAPTQAEAKEAIAPPKKTRAKKLDAAPVADAGNESATTAEAAAESGSPETAQPADAGNAAPAATEPAASSAEPDGATAASPDSQAVSAAGDQACSLDELRVLFGTLTQAGKRTQAVAVVREYGANGLAEIPEEKRGEVFAKLKGL